MRKYIPKFQPGGKSVTKEATVGNDLPTANITKLPPITTQDIVQNANNRLATPPKTPVITTDLGDEVKTKPQKTDKNGNPKGLSEKGQKTMGGIAKGASMATDLAASFIDVDEDSNFQGQQAVGDALMSSGNPYAMAAGAAFKALSAIDQATGMGINTIDKKQASAAGLSKGERLLNNVLGFLPGNPIA